MAHEKWVGVYNKISLYGCSSYHPAKPSIQGVINNTLSNRYNASQAKLLFSVTLLLRMHIAAYTSPCTKKMSSSEE